ncbi:hypothetical protein [Puia sp.]|jgi:hypothetical protein|uniref:hypothetical protein n=1 Tax=Puia sp. TaxID=2045100 RepID=UPI002F425E0A
MNVRTGLSVLLPIVLLAACHKDSSLPKPVTPGGTATSGTMNINLANPKAYSGNVSYEMIISEPGGKVLLDTIVSYAATVKAALSTSAGVVDLTLVDTVDGRHDLTVYKSINPSTWINALPSSYVTGFRSSLPNTTASSLFITHFPAVGAVGTDIFQTFFFNNGSVDSKTGANFSPSENTLDLGYQRYPGAYNYFSIPQLGLYKLYIPTRNKDTLDGAHMDTLLSVTYPRNIPFQMSYFGTTFLGITDTTNRLLDVNFMDAIYEHTLANVDLQYPRQPMQAYELYFNGATSTNDQLGFYSYGKSVPTRWTFPDPAQFTVLNNQIDNLSIKFNTSTANAICYSGWNTSDFKSSLVLYWPPDSTSLHPLSMLTGLKGKFFSGALVSGMKFANFTFQQVPNFSYAGYFNYVNDPAKIATHQLTSTTFYTRYF